MKYSVFAAGLLGASAAFAETPELTVYTYDSFVSDWGPGPAVEKAFEEVCGCDLKLVGAGDGAALLARIKLEGNRSDADVVLGLDTNLTAAANAGIVNEGIQARTLLLDHCDDRIDLVLLGDVELYRRDVVDCIQFCEIRVLSRAGVDMVAVGGERFGEISADAGTGAGHEYRFLLARLGCDSGSCAELNGKQENCGNNQTGRQS